MHVGLQGWPSALPVRWAARRAEAARDGNTVGRGKLLVANAVRRQLVRRSAPARRLPAQRFLGTRVGALCALGRGLTGAPSACA